MTMANMNMYTAEIDILASLVIMSVSSDPGAQGSSRISFFLAPPHSLLSSDFPLAAELMFFPDLSTSSLPPFCVLELMTSRSLTVVRT